MTNSAKVAAADYHATVTQSKTTGWSGGATSERDVRDVANADFANADFEVLGDKFEALEADAPNDEFEDPEDLEAAIDIDEEALDDEFDDLGEEALDDEFDDLEPTIEIGDEEDSSKNRDDEIEADLDAVLRVRLGADDEDDNQPRRAGDSEDDFVALPRQDSEWSCTHCFLIVSKSAARAASCPHCGEDR